MNIHIKNKRISRIATILTVVAASVSCNPLQIDPVNTVSDVNFWTNNELTKAYVSNFYLWSPATANQSFITEMWSDNSVGNLENDWNTYRSYVFSTRDYSSWSISSFTCPWNTNLAHIRAINLALENIDKSSLNTAEKASLMGQSYFFRAWENFELEEYIGSAPIIRHSLTVDDNTMLPRATREEYFDFMLEDLDNAIAQFEVPGVEAPTLGYVGINAAKTFKSRVALYAACAADASTTGIYDRIAESEDAKNLFKFTKNANHYYQIAFDAAKDVIGKYALESSYNTLFNTTTGHLSQECIWPVMFKLNARGGFNPGSVHGPYNHYYEYPDTQADQNTDFRGAAFPTQDLVDCYYMKDKADGKYKPWWETSQVIAWGGTVDADGNFYATTDKYLDMFKDRDSRFYATVVYDSCIHRGHLVQTWVDTTITDGSVLKWSSLHTGFRNTGLNNTTGALQAPSGQASCGTITGYYPAKYMPYKGNTAGGSIDKELVQISYFNLRYAEVLLNYAEAAYKLGNASEATNKVNEIRTRAGIGDYDAAIAGHDLYEEIKMQRRLEFAFEIPSQRYYDIIRWNESVGNTTIDELNKYTKSLLVIRKGQENDTFGKDKLGWPVPKTDPSYFTPVIRTWRPKFASWNKIFDDAKYYTLPFPTTMMTSYKGLVQNPGWANIDVE